MATNQNSWWRTPLLHRSAWLQQREDQIFLALALVIGALTGLAVVTFIVLTERLGMRLYPAAGSPWRRILFPIAGSLTMGWLLYRYFPYARGSGVPQTKAASSPARAGSGCTPLSESSFARLPPRPAP